MSKIVKKGCNVYTYENDEVRYQPFVVYKERGLFGYRITWYVNLINYIEKTYMLSLRQDDSELFKSEQEAKDALAQAIAKREGQKELKIKKWQVQEWDE